MVATSQRVAGPLEGQGGDFRENRTRTVITWDQAMNSKEDLSPPKYEWGPLPEPLVAVPGVTQFV